MSKESDTHKLSASRELSVLQAYSTDENIADVEDEIYMVFQPPSKTPAQYAKDLTERAFRCGGVYEQQYLNEIYMKRCSKPISHTMRW